VVLAVTPSGTVTARATSDRFPPEGTELFAARGAFSGTVVRVFGPVSRPYLAVRPRRPIRAADGAQLLGSGLRGR
jgi:rRNA processing protein Gar1